MKGYQVSKHNIQEFISLVESELEGDVLLIADTQPVGIGKWGMARLWRAWMATTAKYMAENGSVMPLMIKADNSWYGTRPFDCNDAHELFTRQWLGVDNNGYRLSWAKSGEQRVATKGERFDAMRKHQNWCMEKGINLLVPRDSEYTKLQQQQNN